MRAWVPSQNGLVWLPPQRQSRVLVTRATTRPVPLMISRFPRTRSGPFISGDMCNGPARSGNMSTEVLAGSPLAVKFTA